MSRNTLLPASTNVLYQIPMIRYLIEQVEYFSSKIPKGFEKYYEEGRKQKPTTDEIESKSTETKTPSAKSSRPSTPKENKSDWSFGMFTNTNKNSGGSGGSGGGSGRPLGDGTGGDREKWILFGAITSIALLGSLTFFSVGYKEISWKEFVNR